MDMNRIARLQRADEQLRKQMYEIGKVRKLIKKEVMMEVFGNENKSEKQIKGFNICINGIYPNVDNFVDNSNWGEGSGFSF